MMGICVAHRPRVYILFFLLSEIKAAFLEGDEEVEKLIRLFLWCFLLHVCLNKFMKAPVIENCLKPKTIL